MRASQQPSTSIFSICAPSDIQALEQWEAHLYPLVQAGILSVWSARHLSAGSDRLTLMRDHLDQANVIVLPLSADFFINEECTSLMEQALSGESRVIPFLLRFVDWKTSKLASLPCLPANGQFVTTWDNQDQAFHTCVDDLRRLIGLPVVPSQMHKPARTSAGRYQKREAVLGKLHGSYRDQMKQSLRGAAWLELGMTEKPNAVQNAANLLLRLSHSAEQPLPSGTSITQVYDEAEHELLILGEPGTGKSTLLLDLAVHLLRRAQYDETRPLPVILQLSSWAVKRGSLEDWIASEMSELYNVSRQLSLQWVQEDHILPLLDGLDEMQETARPACIAAINTYHREHLLPLVVCSRTAEYEVAAERHRLTLQRAVVVQPLAHEHVDAYLVQAGKPLAALRSTLKKNEELRLLSRIPLMLNILMLTYQGTPVCGLSNKKSLLQKLVLDNYVQQMVQRKGNTKRYPLKRTRAWLSYLARQMREHNQTIFYLEHLQPSWLEAKPRHTYIKLAVRGPSIIIGILISILVSLFLIGNTNFYYLVQNGLMGGLLGGLWYEPRNAVKQRAHRHTWTKNLLKRMALSICIGLISGSSFGFANESRNWFISFGVAMAGGSLILQYLLAAPFCSRPSLENTTSRGGLRVLRFWYAVQGSRALLVAIVAGLSYQLGWELTVVLDKGLNAALSPVVLNLGVIFNVGFSLSLGLSFLFISQILGTHTGDIHLAERMRWSWRGLFNTRHLRITILLIGINIIVVGLGYGLPIGLTSGLTSGLSAWLTDGLNYVSVALNCSFLLGLMQCLTQEHIEDQDRQIANEGIHRSLRNSVVMGIVGGVIFGCISILNYGLGAGLSAWLQAGLRYRLNVGLIQALGVGLLIGPIGALFLWIVTGGLATFRHYIIRILLSHSCIFPMLAPKFLDDATTRFLLRRVGGGFVIGIVRERRKEILGRLLVL